MKHALFVSLLAAVFALSAQVVTAQDADGPGKACRADRDKFCADLKSGDGKLGACMRQHEAELSPECAAARKSDQEARKNIRASCKAETDKFCADTGQDRGGMVKCLESHSSELGQGCADALKARPGAKKA